MDGMKSKYQNEHASCDVKPNADLPEEMRESVLEISSVWTDPDHRKQGYATELMKAVCEEADMSNKVLILQPSPYDTTSGVGKDKLIAWYKRFGFIVTQKTPVLMARAPSFKARQSMVSAAVERATRG
jgi:ribosomal protein S18 acetylase RimI-like enzyme